MSAGFQFQYRDSTNGNSTMCELPTFKKSLIVGIYILVLGIAFGIINIVMSMLVFFQRKYDKRPSYLLMRCFYIFNLAFVFATLVNIVLGTTPTKKLSTVQKIFYSIGFFNQMMSSWMVVLLALVRLLCVIIPFRMRIHAFATKLIISGILIVFGASSAMFISFWASHDNDITNQETMLAVYDLVTVIIVVLLNVDMLVKTNNERTTLTSSAMTNQLSRYVVASSVLFVITTLPYQIIIFTSPKPSDITCADLDRRMIIGQWAYFFKLWNYFLDNMVYLALSSEYRKELKSVIKRLVHRRQPEETRFTAPNPTSSRFTTTNPTSPLPSPGESSHPNTLPKIEKTTDNPSESYGSSVDL